MFFVSKFNFIPCILSNKNLTILSVPLPTSSSFSAFSPTPLPTDNYQRFCSSNRYNFHQASTPNYRDCSSSPNEYRAVVSSPLPESFSDWSPYAVNDRCWLGRRRNRTLPIKSNFPTEWLDAPAERWNCRYKCPTRINPVVGPEEVPVKRICPCPTRSKVPFFRASRTLISI